jgi:O-antigen ligase
MIPPRPERTRKTSVNPRFLLAVFVLVAAVLAGGYPQSVAAALCGVVWLCLAIAATRAPPPIPSPAVCALAFLTALTLVSAVWGDVHEVLRVAPLPALYTGLLYAAEWSAGSTATLDGLRLAITAIAAAGIVGRVSGLAAPSPEPGSVRMAWPIGYANGLGLLCAIGVVLCVSARRWRPAALVCASALVWTFSRSAIVACLAGLVLLAAARGRLPRRVALAGAVALAVVAALVARPVYEGFQSPTPDTRNVQRLATVSGHGRVTLWRTALHEGVDHPIIGGGAGSWRRAAVVNTGRTTVPANAHSLELETFAELGILGLLALAVFLVETLVRQGDPAARAAFAAWALVSAIDWDWQLPAVTGAALIAAGTLTGAGRRRLGPRAALGLALVALGIGLAAELRAFHSAH